MDQIFYGIRDRKIVICALYVRRHSQHDQRRGCVAVKSNRLRETQNAGRPTVGSTS
jgi:hypothetical protein